MSNGQRRWFAVGEQPLKQGALARAERRLELDEVAKFGADRAERRVDFPQLRDELGETKLGGGARPPQLEDFGH